MMSLCVAVRRAGWTFDALEHTDDELSWLVLDMIQQFGLIDQYAVPIAALSTFVQEVRFKYRHNAYHNFKHGVSVAHICFLGLFHTRAAALVLTPIDRFALLLGALCHDVDHPGFNNAFEVSEARVRCALLHPMRLPLVLASDCNAGCQATGLVATVCHHACSLCRPPLLPRRVIHSASWQFDTMTPPSWKTTMRR